MTKVTPMLFSDDMVRALINGCKTQTRRICKLPRNYAQIDFMGGRGDWNDPSAWGFEHPDTGHWALKSDGDIKEIPCPYGHPGDLVWVRETWSGDYAYADEKPSERVSVMTPDGPYYKDCIWYWADGDPEFGDWERPRPSTQMPRWASRLTLRITDVRVERVQDISEEGAIAEGVLIEEIPDSGSTSARYGCAGRYYAEEAFADLWDSIYTDRSHGWDANPWVWAISFEIIHSNVDYVLAKEAG